MGYDKALAKAMRYCSFQERCILDLENRFRAWNVKKEDWDKLIDKLIEDNFLDEDRYIEAFVRGKFIIKKWGKNKIKAGLIAKRVFSNKIDDIIAQEIEEADYSNTLKDLIRKKNLLITEKDKVKRKDKLYRYMLGKGYEQELVYKALKTII